MRVAPIFLLLLAVLSGCGYGLNAGRLRPGLETVSVPYFENRSNEPELEVELTEAIIDGLIADRTLKVVDEGQSDAVVLGTIRSYRQDEDFYGEDRRAERYKITITVQVSMVDAQTNEDIAKSTTIRGDGTYLIEEGLDGELAAREEAAEEIVAGILNLVVEEW